MSEVERMGGSVHCVETGFFKEAIGRSAYEYQQEIERAERIVVGVNKFQTDNPEVPGVLKLNPELEHFQVDRLKSLRNKRDNKKVEACKERLRKVAAGNENIVEPVLEAVEAYVTVGEISNVFREVWGEHRDNR